MFKIEDALSRTLSDDFYKAIIISLIVMGVWTTIMVGITAWKEVELAKISCEKVVDVKK